MKWALVDSDNIIQNVIAYDGADEYIPPQGVTLQQVNDWLHIGDNVNQPQ
jgi:hypothetical protein